MTDISQ